MRKFLKSLSHLERAEMTIPLGSQTFSKSRTQYPVGISPLYAKKGSGPHIWDIDGNKYVDLVNSLAAVTIGYGDKGLSRAVRNQLKSGVILSLPSILEAEVSELMVELIPSAEMVRFSKNGSDATAAAIRLARAYTGRDHILMCGYHGWHDWYLAMGINKSKDLEKNLVAGIDKRGIPNKLKNSIFSFNYNDIESLEKIVKEKNIGVIKMEVIRNFEPKNNFLNNVQSIARKNNIVLIFDECSSGFRETYGGIYKKYSLNPDMVVFGKALGNGYAITAVLGKKNIMENAQKTFISSTFWTERSGPTAALKTLEIMVQKKSWRYITDLGKKIKQKWEKIAKNHKLKISISGIDAMPGFNFLCKNNLTYRTFITQEMLKKKILASNNIYCSLSHNERIVENYFDKLDKIFKKIKKFEDNEVNPKLFLEGPECISGLNRFN